MMIYLTQYVMEEKMMKATGIVRRIDYPVIIGQSQETQINQWFSLILSKEDLLESSYHGILKR